MKPEQKKTPGLNFPKLKLTVVKQNGPCYHNYKPGDELILNDFTHPPRDFCLGLSQSAFPCLYALTFGAEFSFMQNTRSILVTCPDNAKLTFKLEILDDKGNVVVKQRAEKPEGPNPKTMEVEVQQVSGHCFYNYKQGDKFELTGLKTPQGFCGAAYSVLFPVLFGLNFGASFPFEQDFNCKTGIACPDGGNLKFKARRKSSD